MSMSIAQKAVAHLDIPESELPLLTFHHVYFKPTSLPLRYGTVVEKKQNPL
jgi:hypothetical protein